MRFRAGFLAKLEPHEHDEIEKQIKAGKTMQHLFPTQAPRSTFPEAALAFATRSRLGRDANGQVLQSEAHEFLDRAGVEDENVRDLWLDLWAVIDGELAAMHHEEIEAMRDR